MRPNAAESENWFEVSGPKKLESKVRFEKYERFFLVCVWHRPTYYFTYTFAAPKPKTYDKYVNQARIKPDIFSILSPNPTRKTRPDLQL